MLTMTRTKPEVFPYIRKSRLSVFEFLKPVPVQVLFQLERAVMEKKVPKHATLFLEEDRADFIWFIQEGHVKEVRHLPDGRNQTVSMAGPGEMAGVSALDRGNYGFHAIAETDTLLTALSVEAFRNLMEKFPLVGLAVVSKISLLLRRSKEQLIFSQESAEKRLLHTLLELMAEYGRTIPLTRREIAEMAGTAVETCIRAFSRMESAGLIASVHGKLTIRNLERLKARFEAV